MCQEEYIFEGEVFYWWPIQKPGEKLMKKQEAIVGVEAMPEQHIAFFVVQQIQGKERLGQVHKLIIMLGYLHLFAHRRLFYRP
jgi:hypothetical protein